jgi:hypothetical protein
MSAVANLKPWSPGQSGNPNGRPVGSRTVFSQAFLRDLASDWSEGGLEAMRWTRKNQPAVYFATCARLLPADVTVTLQESSALDQNDLAILRAIKDSIPNANSRSPTEVLEYVRDTLRAAGAKPIEVAYR